MNQRLLDLYRNLSVHATADREHEAALELLLLVMIADRHISDEEIDEIRQISDDSGFETDTFSFDQQLGPAIAKVRAAERQPDPDEKVGEDAAEADAEEAEPGDAPEEGGEGVDGG